MKQIKLFIHIATKELQKAIMDISYLFMAIIISYYLKLWLS